MDIKIQAYITMDSRHFIRQKKKRKKRISGHFITEHNLEHTWKCRVYKNIAFVTTANSGSTSFSFGYDAFILNVNFTFQVNVPALTGL